MSKFGVVMNAGNLVLFPFFNLHFSKRLRQHQMQALLVSSPPNVSAVSEFICALAAPPELN
jgi:hypothetical protein